MRLHQPHRPMQQAQPGEKPTQRPLGTDRKSQGATGMGIPASSSTAYFAGRGLETKASQEPRRLLSAPLPGALACGPNSSRRQTGSDILTLLHSFLSVHPPRIHCPRRPHHAVPLDWTMGGIPAQYTASGVQCQQVRVQAARGRWEESQN